jgi:antitoxin Phd
LAKGSLPLIGNRWAGMRAAASQACQSAAIDATLPHRYLLSSYLARTTSMDGSQWSLQDAKNRFSAVVAAASKGEPQTVTKRGKPTVVVLSVTDYEKLTRRDAKRPSFVEHLLAMPKDDGEFERMELEPRDIEF